MSDLRELYQEVILDHGRRPRNHRVPEGCNCTAEGHNPLCGDRIGVRLRCEHDRIEDAGFEGSGCAICMAAASTLTEAVKGRTKEEFFALLESFLDMIVHGIPEASQKLPAKLGVFKGVAEFPMRVKCATLAWHTAAAALQGKPTASTEETDHGGSGTGG